MKLHELKTLPGFFEDVWSGSKTFELRRDDRGYQRGDRLLLREYDCGMYRQRAIVADVSYVTCGGILGALQHGHVCMGIRIVTKYERYDTNNPPDVMALSSKGTNA